VMFGSGLPSAVQFSVTLSPSLLFWLPEMWTMFGGTEKTMKATVLGTIYYSSMAV